MKNILYIILQASMTMLACSDTRKERTDWTLLNLKGKVKEFKEESFYAVEESGKAAKGDKGGKDPHMIHVVFNKNGYRTNEYMYEHDYSLYLKHDYIRNDNGKISEMIQTYGSTNETTRFVFEYEENGHAAKLTAYDKDGSLDYTQQFTYNDDGYVILTEIYFFNSYMNRKILSTYNDSYNNIETTFLDYNDELLYKLTYSYDSNHNIAEECRYNSDNELESCWTYTYELDSSSNWIVRNEYQDSKLIYIREREIEYF